MACPGQMLLHKKLHSITVLAALVSFMIDVNLFFDPYIFWGLNPATLDIQRIKESLLNMCLLQAKAHSPLSRFPGGELSSYCLLLY